MGGGRGKALACLVECVCVLIGWVGGWVGADFACWISGRGGGAMCIFRQTEWVMEGWGEVGERLGRVGC